MQYTLPVAVIILLILMICIHAHFIRRIESFGVNAGYYLSGDGNWAGQMQPAAASTNGSTGLVPSPLAGQQNSYLRGDGKWIQAGNAPTAAIYYLAVQNEGSVNPLPTGPVLFPSKPSSAGAIGVITKLANNYQFTLAVGYSYKLTAALGEPSSTNGFIYQWMDVTSGSNVALGVSGAMPGMNAHAVAYFTPTVTSTVLVYIHWSNGGYILPSTLGRASFALIEVVSNNNTISAFTGSSSAGDGFAGYIPAPLAGQQNYVLNGSGKWDGPQYLMVTNPAGQSSVSAGTVFKWDPSTNVFAGGGVIKLLPNNTQFQLAAGYNFKLTAVLNHTGGPECTYRWYDFTNSKLIGVGGNVNCLHAPQNGTAFAYVTTVSPVTVQLNIMYVQNGSVSIAGFNTTTNCVSWAAIEVMR